MTTLWAQETAERFWTDAGDPPPAFPRDLRRSIALALPLAVVDLPRLRVGRIGAWLAQRGVAFSVAERDRPLRACLLVHQGAGIVFLDGADPDDERRFSLAHEVAHFLAEYALPRQRALDRLGTSVLSVLDGHRSPSDAERVDAVLAGVGLQPRLHLMERTPDGHPAHGHISQAERRADDLALELLAPADAVRTSIGQPATRAEVQPVLCAAFGLPEPVSHAYAARFASDDAAPPPLLARLGLLPPGSGA
jgi:hypothetical protein